MDLLTTPETKKKVFKLNLVLTPAQAKIDASPARFKIVRCGRKFGKTTYAEKKALDWLGKPNSVVWYVSPTIKQGKIIAWSEFKRMIPPEALGKKPNDTDLVITLKNGSQLYLMGADDPDSLRGPAPSGVIFEEAAFIRREAWHEVVRPNLAPKKAPALFIGTPKGFNWFYDLEQEALKNPEKWGVWHYSIFDNPHIDRQEIEECRRSCDSTAVWNQEYMAEYESSVGRVFAALNADRHATSLQTPRGKVFRSVDWGLRDKTGGLWAMTRMIDGKQKLCVYREYADNNLSAPAQAEIIKNMTGDTEQVERTAISHDAAKEDNTKKGLTVIWHFRQAGINPLIPSSRDKKHSRQMIIDLIRQDRLLIDKDRCPKLWKQMLTYEWKDTLMESVDESVECDLVDSLHYMVEMLQFELFMEHAHKEKTHEEKVKEYQVEKANLARPKWKIEDREPLTAFDFSDSPAGYL
jgi:hypothetical protein